MDVQESRRPASRYDAPTAIAVLDVAAQRGREVGGARFHHRQRARHGDDLSSSIGEGADVRSNTEAAGAALSGPPAVYRSGARAPGRRVALAREGHRYRGHMVAAEEDPG
jgi:hypothetical protein